MNKILNWTLGGFFRTLGRFLLYLCVSILIYGFLYKSGFKLPFMVVNATTDYSDYSQSIINYMQNWGSTQSSKNHLYSSNASKTSTFFSTYIYSNLSDQPYPFLQKDKYYSVTFIFGDGEHQIYPNWEQHISNGMISSSSIFLSDPFSYIWIWLPDNDTNSLDLQTHVSSEYLNALVVSDITVDSSMTYNRYFITWAFSPKIDMRRLQFRTNFLDSSISSSKTYFYNIVNFGEIQESDIPSLGRSINDVINDLIDSIDDTANDIGDHLENGTLLELFPNFKLDSEDFISDIVTLPLDSLNAILENNYQDLCGSLKGTTFCFPNGSFIWNRSNTSTFFGNANYSGFIAFFELVVGGLLIYYSLVSCVKSIMKILDPVEHGIEVMKL